MVTIPAVPPYSSTTGRLQPVGLDLGHHRIVVQRCGHCRDGLGQMGKPGAGAIVDRNPEDLFDVHDPDGFVEVTVDDREAGVAGAHRFGD